MNCSIIGVSVRLPEGLDKEGFWEALVEEKSFLDGMSASRYDLHNRQQHRSWGDISKINGMYLEDIDCFDRNLFNLSVPGLMFSDPRQRLLLESCWSAIEDAGLQISDLKDKKVGVFLSQDGFDLSSYFNNIPEEELSEQQDFIIPGNVSSFLASRISNTLDLKGPSMVVDSTCSSIYVAIHHARQALKNGECDYALVGGCTLFMEPWKEGENKPTYHESGVNNIKSFSENANGYCSSEGCGAIVLQRSHPDDDKDHSSYGVIIGSGYNSGGKTRSFTQPNQAQQELLFNTVLKDAKKTAANINYIESHGVGSVMGDTIEANALINVFKREKGNPCYISTIKPNIGHAHSSSGLYSLLKALLSIKYNKIISIKGINPSKINRNIIKERSGIQFLDKTIDWPQDKEESGKRMAFLSSYGANNVNAAILIEEAKEYAKDNNQEEVLICLSAKTKEQLEQQQINLLNYITKEKEPSNLIDLSYTLQLGREAMRYRFATKVDSLDQLKTILQIDFKEQISNKNIFIGDSTSQKDSNKILLKNESMLDQLLVSSFEERDLEKLADLWVKGINIKWHFCYKNINSKKIHLPTYPFAREQYWIPEGKELNVPSSSNAHLHPLLHSNESDLSEQKYQSTYTGLESFLFDHQIKGEKILPGVAYLELARAAGQQGIGKPITQLLDINWLHPVRVNGSPAKIGISLFVKEDVIGYEVYSEQGTSEVIHSQGKLSTAVLGIEERLDIEKLRSVLSSEKSGVACYEAFKALGFDLGLSFQGIDKLYYNSEGSLSKISLPKEDGYVLQPGLLDSALQTYMGLSFSTPEKPLSIPFSIGEVNIYGDVGATAWCYARKSVSDNPDSNIKSYDIDMLSDTGEVLLGFKNFVVLPMNGIQKSDDITLEEPTLELNKNTWSASSIVKSKDVSLSDSLNRRVLTTETLGELHGSATSYFKSILSSFIRLSVDRIDISDPFEKYGIDSIMIVKLTNKLSEDFEDLPSTLFFEYQNLEDLISYFMDEHSDRLQEITSFVSESETPLLTTKAIDTSGVDLKSGISKRTRFLSSREALLPVEDSFRDREDIAIIGLSGRYPGANTINEFWDNLKAGIDSVTEIPSDRWDMDNFYDADKNVLGKSYSKWGGFIDNIDKFDPLFFNITPRDAENMDPQERLFLQTVWESLEDAGYTRDRLQEVKSSTTSNLGGYVGVYAGVMYSDYQLFGVEETLKGNPISLSSSPSSVANRASYYLNLHGPSMGVDTMCSSSLTAIHLAIEAIHNGHCGMAIAGGVNLSIHPNKYKILSQSRFVSDKGRCDSFGEGGSGYVPGEGVGVVVLKPLSQAEADGDQIYGVIKGSSLNHGGKTNGYSVPNPNAQAEVIKEAISRAGVKPEDFSYIEAHGTGTSLGDPIEIAGLSKAFESKTKEGQYCAIGSVKSNIGHGESAAGISGLTKVLLQLKNKQIVPSLHSKVLNTNINFKKTPFKVQQELTSWDIKEDQTRLAGISSFGAGGSNAHIIIEEYVEKKENVYTSNSPAIILLSARNEEQLKAQVTNLSIYLDVNSDVNLYELSYTLQIGRESMVERLAFIASTVEEARIHLQKYIEGAREGLYVGNIKNGEQDFLLEGTARAAYIQTAISKQQTKALAQLWVKGITIDWSLLYEENKPNKISLPTYPFARNHCWYRIPKQSSIYLNDNLESKKMNKIGKVVLSDLVSNDDKNIKENVKSVDKTIQYNGEKVENHIKGKDAKGVTKKLKELFGEVLYIPSNDIDEELAFVDLGIDSINGVELIRYINNAFNLNLEAIILYDYYTINKLSGLILKESNLLKISKEEYSNIILDPVSEVLQNEESIVNRVTIENKQAIKLSGIANDIQEKDAKGVTKKLKELFEEVLYIPSNDIDEELAFVDLGIDSINGVELIRYINNAFNLNLEAIILYDYYTINKLSGLILKESNIILDPVSQVLLNEEPRANSTTVENEEITKLSRIASDDTQGKDAKSVTKKLKELFEEVLYIPFNDIDEELAFVDLGIDSINGVELIRYINNAFNLNLEAIILYDYYTINKLSGLILKEYNPLNEQVDNSNTKANSTIKLSTPKISFDSVKSFTIAEKKDLTLAKIDSLQSIDESKKGDKLIEDIAIIGMSGRFPDAVNTNEFWENIKAGKNSIKEVPERKWSIPQFFDEDRKVEGKSYAKWMGYLDDEDKFDPLFFNISPREAERMDPQQRLFIEESWKAMEDSGYTRALLSGQKCGVFVGVGQGDYMNDVKHQEMDSHTFTGSSSSILAGRISYHLNLDGPAISLDTACSSSLVAIHQACQSIRVGECETALAGGVYVMTSERLHIETSKSGMLSEDGKCHTFDNKANGFVPGEAVGVLLLKSLTQAEIDGDRIYGVIKGSAINQDGKTNGITAPNVDSQNRLQEQVYKRYNIDPSTINYVESHGTGTKLGDPIEIKALKRSFESTENKENSCGIGSVKTNIGHTLTAAGITGVIKVLLSLKHKQIPPTLNYNVLNEHINLTGSPFYVNTALKEWQVNENQPRKAAISGFGFSGTNAHIVLEEYINNNRKPYVSDAPAIILLSAKNKDRLKDQANNLTKYLESNPDLDLYDIAYTLQVGRESMEERLAFIVSDKVELEKNLTKFKLGETAGLICGNSKNNKNDFFLIGNAGKAYIEVAIRDKEHASLAQLWIKSVAIDWELLYTEGNRPNKISLPTYPFARERHWISESNNSPLLTAKATAHLHPLLHSNESDLSEQKYRSTYTGLESFLFDHQIKGEKVLPGMAHLELARAAGQQGTGKPITQLLDINWLHPVRVNGSPMQIDISVFAEGDVVGYEVYSEQGTSEVIHSQGKVSTTTMGVEERLDIEKLKSVLSSEKSGVACYEAFKALGINYGLSFQGIDKLYYNSEGSLSKISLPKEDGYVLQPGLLDSALQTCMGLSFSTPEEPLSIPFNVGEVNIYGDVGATAWCYARRSSLDNPDSNIKSYDIDMLSDMGEVLLRFKNFVVLPMDGIQKSNDIPLEEPTLELYKNIWSASSIVKSKDTSLFDALILLAGGSVGLADSLQESLEKEVIAINEDSELPYYHKIQEIVQSRLGSEKKTVITVIYCNNDADAYGFINGLLKTAEQESSKLFCKTLGVPSLSLNALDSLLECIQSESETLEKEVRYIGNRREARSLSVFIPEPVKAIKEGGVYLITGGCGGLGNIFASYISKTKNTQLILTGRSQESKLSEKELSALNAVYYPCDITNKDAVDRLITTIVSTYDHLDGILHSAGVLSDSFLKDKTQEESSLVLSPKIMGAKYLDASTKDLTLDFMVYFSSVAGVMGNVGQADYASANAWMDQYASSRNVLVSKGKRTGHTISINWPLWLEGGMQVDKDSEKYLYQKSGMIPLPTHKGITAFESLLGSSLDQGIVMYGYASSMTKKMTEKTNYISKNKKALTRETLGELHGSATSYFKSMISSVLKLSVDRIDVSDPFEKYGVDSIMIVKLTNELSEAFEDLPSTLFFEYQNLEDLISYFMDEHSDRLQEITGFVSESETPLLTTKAIDTSGVDLKSGISKRTRFLSSREALLPVEDSFRDREDIAIIGLSGRYPGANTINEFWDNLKAGIDSVTEIPSDRWDMSNFYDADKNVLGKSYSKWGGFIDNIDKFDPLFFNISPREAKLMDPQERLFLQTVWESLEDAGYTRDRLQEVKSSTASNLGGYVGVYAGVMYGEYQLYGAEEALKGSPLSLLNSPSSIANRASYCLNLHGPSMGIDTMCSSSLTAIHLAIEAIHNGQCGMAIAGGVNLSIHPNKYKYLSQSKFISDKGKCESFGEGGSGYVPSEGVGVVILKSLSQAEADGDQIYGVIKGSSLNHGGKTNGYSVPNPNAQADVIKEAIARSGVRPENFSYIEAHGTGTSLGDPIEIAGLSKAFESKSKGGQYCAIGSVKSNIGHGESAAGVSGLTKVLLQLKHKQLVPSLHSELLNKSINFEKTPFKIQHKLTDWVVDDAQSRIAGISSFGAGGSNAHLIIEEYIAKKEDVYISNSPAIILLSAKNKDRLKDQVINLLCYLEGDIDANLYDIGYTLQVGREFMNERLAFIASDLEEVKVHLQKYIEGKSEDLFLGVGDIKEIELDSLLGGETRVTYIQRAISQQQTKVLAQLWVKGAVIDWRLLYKKANTPNKISLPTYPFAKDRYWYDTLFKQKKSMTQINNNNKDEMKRESMWDSMRMHEVKKVLVDGDIIKVDFIENGTIAIVKIESRELKNMINQELIDSLEKTFLDLHDNKKLKVVIVTGYDNVFSMGGSQEALEAIASKRFKCSEAPFIYKGFLDFEIPVVSAIQGHAFGAGLLFGLYADIVLMSEESIYTTNFMKFGFTPGMGSTYILGEKLGKPLANEMMLTGKQLKGEEIRIRGASVTITKDVLKEAIMIAKDLCLKPRNSLKVLKAHLTKDIIPLLEKYISEEEEMHVLTFHTNEVSKKIDLTFQNRSVMPVKSKEKSILNQSSTALVSKVKLDDLNYTVKNEEHAINSQGSVSLESITDITKSPKKRLSEKLDIDVVIDQLKVLLNELLHIPVQEINIQESFVDFGLDSIGSVELMSSVNKMFDVNLEAIVLYDYSTIHKLSQLIVENSEKIIDNTLDDYGNETFSSFQEPSFSIQQETLPNVDSSQVKLNQLPEVKISAIKKTDNNNSVALTTGKLKALIEEILHISIDQINDDEAFADMGMDSISGLEFVSFVNKEFDVNFEAIILYDYQTLNRLSTLIAKESSNLIVEVEPPEVALPNLDVQIEQKTFEKINLNNDLEVNIKPEKIIKKESLNENHDPKELCDIAIIGMSGKFPDASNVSEFWENLKSGKDSITEVPKRKWSVDDFYDEQKETEGKSYSKWMGAISDEDKFDPLFFNISPIEAEHMDPQQRLFLEECWKTIEDSGYTGKALADQKCGVFVGVEVGDYRVDINSKDIDGHFLSSNSSSLLAGRVSYFFNFTGPAISISTACSSSLVAVHSACQSIMLNDCDTALAGGVCIMTSERMHIGTSKSGMLSDDGKCHTFDNQANGFVPGEAVGVVLLKSLKKAEEDGDRIYGVIKGSGVNQDGKTNGMTAPSATSQTHLQSDVYNKFKIDPETITYIEAHGTGTKLGDPIEIKALKDSFGKYTKKTGFCGIGSVKTNIGHALTAAGITGLIKVLLSIKNKQLPATLNYESLNEHINLNKSPFYINNSLKDWESVKGLPRRAGINSFGFSGTNAHIVVEEYISKKTVSFTSDSPGVIILSARNLDRLQVHASNLRVYLEQTTAINLHDLAYSLQVGREPMDERLAFIAHSIDDLLLQLDRYLQGDFLQLYKGNINEKQSGFILKGNAGKSYLDIAIRDKELDSLAQLWVNGVIIDWQLLYGEVRPNKISLPTYPFGKKSYWIEKTDTSGLTVSKNVLHPLLHVNNSNFREQRFTNTYTGKELFLSDHKLRGEKILPGVAYLELANIAGSISLEQPITQLRDVTWLQPIHVNGSPEQVEISVFKEGDSLDYKVYTDLAGSEVIHGQGKLFTISLPTVKHFDIEELKALLEYQKEGAACYEIFKELGVDYGSSFKGLETLYYNAEGSLSKISLPKEQGYVLQPGILDSALQTCIGLSFSESELSLSIPFSVQEVNIYGDVGATTWCYARSSEGSSLDSNIKSYDIDMLSDTGEVLLSFKNFLALSIDGFAKDKEDVGLDLYSNIWKECPIVKSEIVTETTSLIILAGGSVVLTDKLQESLEEEVIDVNENNEIEYYHKLQEIVQSRLGTKEKITITVIYDVSDYVDYAFISGLIKTAELESSKIIGKTIGVPSLSLKELDSLTDIIKSESGASGKEIRYMGGKREVRSLSVLSSILEPKTETNIKKDGVYLITGGAGGLGQIFASHISKTKGTILILTGRSKTSRLSKEELTSMNAVYYPCDFIDAIAVDTLIKQILADYGVLDGVLHSAGVIRDSFLSQKTNEESALVLAPKILGAKHLDNSTKDLALDFMVYFSSAAGALGNLGQGDYSSANAWLDNYAFYRNELVSKGKRKGRTLSINWPLWKEGGMQIGADNEKYLEQKLGMTPLPILDGVEAFDTLLNYNISQGFVAYGFRGRMAKSLVNTSKQSIIKTRINPLDTVLEQQVLEEITTIVSQVIKLDTNQISIHKELIDYGFDSILSAKFILQINELLSICLSVANFFEYNTIKDLTKYILDEHSPQIQNHKNRLQQQLYNTTDIKIKNAITVDAILDKYKVLFKEGKGGTIGVILPGMPGIVDGYYELSEGLKEETVYGINMVGFDGDQPLTSIESIAEHYCNIIQTIHNKEEIKLYAHSYGGVVLLELLELLKSKGVKIKGIVLLDSYATTLEMDLKEKISLFITLLIKQSNLDIPMSDIQKFRDEIVENSKENKGDLIFSFLRERGTNLDKDFFFYMYTLFETSMDIKYKQKGVLDYEVILVKTKKLPNDYEDDSLGWSPYYKSIKIVESEADHFDIVKEPFVSKWVDQLEQIKK